MSGRAAVRQVSRFRSRDPMVRRIVTSHDAAGKSVVWMDGCATNHKYLNDRIISTLLWSTEGGTPDYTADGDGGAKLLGTAPPPGGTRFVHCEVAPGTQLGDWPALYRTDSLDYTVIISGEISLYLDDQRVVCRAGDVIVGRGTRQAWVNEGPDPCRAVTVMIDAVPKREDSVKGMVTYLG